MSTRIIQKDGSCIVRANGCAPDFLDYITQHQAFLFDYFASSNIILDWSLDSLMVLGKRLTELKQEKSIFSDELANGLIAYCGEAIRTCMGGEWFMRIQLADLLGGVRYFPGIRTSSGKELVNFAACIEDDLERENEYCRFPYQIKIDLEPPLPVRKSTAHPLGDDKFPPLR